MSPPPRRSAPPQVLPCRHTFKEGAIDAWLLGQGRAPPTATSPLKGLPTCPLCKAVPIVVPAPELPAPPPGWAPPARTQVAPTSSTTAFELTHRRPVSPTAWAPVTA